MGKITEHQGTDKGIQYRRSEQIKDQIRVRRIQDREVPFSRYWNAEVAYKHMKLVEQLPLFKLTPDEYRLFRALTFYSDGSGIIQDEDMFQEIFPNYSKDLDSLVVKGFVQEDRIHLVYNFL